MSNDEWQREYREQNEREISQRKQQRQREYLECLERFASETLKALQIAVKQPGDVEMLVQQQAEEWQELQRLKKLLK